MPLNGNAWCLKTLFVFRHPFVSIDLKDEAKKCSRTNGLCIFTDNAALLCQMLEKLSSILSEIKSPHPIVFIATTKEDIDGKLFAINQAKVSVIEIIFTDKGSDMDEIVTRIQNRMSQLKHGIA